MRKLTITRALAEVKLLENKITKKISEMNVVGLKSNSSDLVKNANKSPDDFKRDGKAEYQSIWDLISLRDEIKRKIIQSNATTKVVCGESRYTVAELIERKNSISYEKSLLDKLKREKLTIDQKLEEENEKVERDAQRLKDMYIGNSKDNNKNLVEQAEAIYKSHIDSNKYSVIDSITILREIDKLSKILDDFLMEVDFSLSESNAKTEITVSK